MAKTQSTQQIRVTDLYDLLHSNLHSIALEHNTGEYSYAYECDCADGKHQDENQEYIFENCENRQYTEEFLNRWNLAYSHHIDLVLELVTYGIEREKVITNLEEVSELLEVV